MFKKSCDCEKEIEILINKIIIKSSSDIDVNFNWPYLKLEKFGHWSLTVKKIFFRYYYRLLNCPTYWIDTEIYKIIQVYRCHQEHR